METQELLQKLEARGITLTLCGQDLSASPETIPNGILTTIQAHKSALIRHLQAQPPATPSPNRDTPPGTLLDDHRALAVDFLEAVEALLVTVKDERPPSFRTPNLNRDLKRLEAELTAWRAVLIPDEPESTATGDSLAEQYRAREGVN
jgi:hypothetical protein